MQLTKSTGSSIKDEFHFRAGVQHLGRLSRSPSASTSASSVPADFRVRTGLQRPANSYVDDSDSKVACYASLVQHGHRTDSGSYTSWIPREEKSKHVTCMKMNSAYKGQPQYSITSVQLVEAIPVTFQRPNQVQGINKDQILQPNGHAWSKSSSRKKKITEEKYKPSSTSILWIKAPIYKKEAAGHVAILWK